jgi:predicted DNA-binding transcriptional regulator YafY
MNIGWAVGQSAASSEGAVLQSTEGVDLVQTVQTAIDNGGRLYMDYISKTGRKWRVVSPLGWLQHGVSFDAYCEENEENRSFRVDRIHDVKSL